MTHFIAVSALLQWSGVKPTVSARYPVLRTITKPQCPKIMGFQRLDDSPLCPPTIAL